ncbi:Os08g0351300 [Oryza sativa Japonica Group]|uniref:Os08g0351300 protein n=2 Tax=Oryza sativa subsp. japonica TaxID=39947 RepID=Q0J688_ORYSJ|nr:Os08g0351300 [Oryza sativa Japonica Group]BAG90887.1 unnamed protein product [Oryza sativa Japonica Group]BAT05058.1 Os08g0351300 [Oryza sativa Japonica Group]|eukprot:NP_001061613.1 Os08g0351300 [Oryza sativa Japonica Group]
MAAVPCGESFPCAAILRLRLRRYWSGRNMDLLVLSASDVTPSPPQTSPASLIPSRSSLLSHAGQHTEVSPSTPSAARAGITSKRMQATIKPNRICGWFCFSSASVVAIAGCHAQHVTIDDGWISCLLCCVVSSE